MKQHQYTGVTKMAAASQMIDGLVCTDTGILNWKGDAAVQALGCR